MFEVDFFPCIFAEELFECNGGGGGGGVIGGVIGIPIVVVVVVGGDVFVVDDGHV